MPLTKQQLWRTGMRCSMSLTGVPGKLDPFSKDRPLGDVSASYFGSELSPNRANLTMCCE